MGKSTLAGQLEKTLIGCILKYHATVPSESSLKYNVEAIIEYAKSCDYTLRRRQKLQMVSACENAIEYVRKTNECNDSEDSDFEFDQEVDLVHVSDSNAMNRSLMGMYQNREVKEISVAEPLIRDADMLESAGFALSTKVEVLAKSAPKRKNESTKENTKKVKSQWTTPTSKLKDMGGIDDIVKDLMQLVGMPLSHPEIYQHLGIVPPRGILLHGPPGCGKTMLANAIAGEFNVPFINIAAPIIVSGMSGESEKKIREVFEEAKSLAPCILFIDEIDAITPKRETAQREMERRIVAQLLTCMDDVSLEKTNYKPVIIIGATNRPDSIDPALRRAGRFDREISMGVPDELGRSRILEKLCQKLKLEGTIDYKDLARLTPGYVGADLSALASEAGLIAVRRIFESMVGNSEDQMNIDGNEQTDSVDMISKFISAAGSALSLDQLDSLCITYQDFTDATKIVQPSSKREGFATVPNVTWEDIGALSSVADELRMAVVEPIKHPEYFASVGISSAMGVLLYGPPGCGKTLLAKAVANESSCNFLSVKGPELLNKYVGESERAIRMVFSRAQASSPCVIFFDELDALCPSRSDSADSQSSSRLVNTLLTEMDGMNSRKQVFVIAATNRPDMIDPAMLRPGRLDKTLYVDLPNTIERHEILKTLSRKTPLHPDVDLASISSHPQCEGMSGADLASLIRESSVTALRRLYYTGDSPTHAQNIQVTNEDFMKAFTKISPSVKPKDIKKYNLLRVKFGSSVDTPPVPIHEKTQ